MPVSESRQLALAVSLDDDARFENYLISSANKQAVDCLKAKGKSEQFIYIWGAASTGLTHLLQASCHQYSMGNRGSLYVPMAEKSRFTPEILHGTNTLSLVCIDDFDQIAGNDHWESAFFTAFNAIRESGTRLIIAAKAAPKNLNIRLADLQSRLQSALVFQLAELSDEEKLRALQLRAKNRGMDLADAVAEYILLRAERSLVALMAVLDKLDASSLQEQRRLTIPLVKATMQW
ncbi:MAG: DnaA regulatory inactivator Hda [Proteobacteria bacterium]|nr:DnaA regulatory inactivator Hda [Pseudomonadota bacterium]